MYVTHNEIVAVSHKLNHRVSTSIFGCYSTCTFRREYITALFGNIEFIRHLFGVDSMFTFTRKEAAVHRLARRYVHEGIGCGATTLQVFFMNSGGDEADVD